MKPETRLDSAVFQLTPTRTRYDLIIIANGKREKIASGLLNPFLAHLKTAKDQTEKGGYSIRLEPDPGTDPLWFTKGTVERFVRYVSSPEVLERVNTLELEILQIKEAIAIQGNDNRGLSTQVEDHPSRGKGYFEASKPVCNCDMEKAMVLYKHESNRRLSNGSIMQEDNSRIELLRALDMRKTVLRKEQGMAFACAVAAGFDVDHVAQLILFAERFGASRLLEACMRFLGLMQAKHKTGQWPEIIAEKIMSYQSKFSFMNPSATILAGDTRKQKESKEAWPLYDDELGLESHAKAGKSCVADLSSSHLSSDPNRDGRSLSDPLVPLYPQYYHYQVENPMFLQWPSHSLLGRPVPQSYPLKGVPHYQNYLASGPSFQSPYPSVVDPSSSNSQHVGFKRNSMDNSDSNNESQTRELGVSSARIQDGIDHHAPWSEKESSQDRNKQKSVGCSGKGQSDMVVIQNINNIPSKGHEMSASDSEKQIQVAKSNAPERENDSSMSVKKNGGSTKSPKTSNTDEKQHVDYGQQEDVGNWQAFQDLLLRVQKENTSFICRDMSTTEKKPPPKKRLNKSEADPTVLPERYIGDAEELIMNGFDMNSDFSSSLQKSEIYSSRTKNQHIDEPHDLSLMPNHGLYKVGFDPLKDFDMQNPVRNAIKREITRQENESKSIRGLSKEKKSGAVKNGLEKQKLDAMIRKGKSSKSNLLVEAQDRADKLRAFKADLQKAKKEKEEAEIKRLEIMKMERQKRIAARSRSTVTQSSLNGQQTGARKPVNFSASTHKGSNLSDRVPTSSPKQKLPRSGTSVAQALLIPQQTRGQKTRFSPSPCRSGKFSDAWPAASLPLQKLPRSSASVSQSTSNPQQSRAQKTRLSPNPCTGAKFSDTLRASSSTFQKLRSSTNVSQLTTNAQQSSAQKSTRLSPSSYKSSKFIDTLTSSLQKLPTRITSVRSPDSHKITRLYGNTHLIRNGSKCSIPPASEKEKVSNSLVLDAQATPIQPKRVSYPKVSGMHCASSVGSVSSNQVPKKTVLPEPQAKRTSTILHLDKTKSTSLTENKIRTVKGSPGKVQKNSSTWETLDRTGTKASLASEGIRAKDTNKDALMLNIDDDDIVDKAVVVLENEMIPEPVVQADIPSPPLAPNAGEVDDCSDRKLVEKPSSFEVISWNFSNSTVAVKPCHAQHAGATSPQNPTTRNAEHIKDPVYGDVATMCSKSNKAHSSNSVSVNSSSVGEVHAMHGNSHNKESLKGFKDILKFRRKGQSSASVPTLRNLISQDSGIECTPPKGYRSFSLFSSFHTMTHEKVTA